MTGTELQAKLTDGKAWGVVGRRRVSVSATYVVPLLRGTDEPPDTVEAVVALRWGGTAFLLPRRAAPMTLRRLQTDDGGTARWQGSATITVRPFFSTLMQLGVDGHGGLRSSCRVVAVPIGGYLVALLAVVTMLALVILRSYFVISTFSARVLDVQAGVLGGLMSATILLLFSLARTAKPRLGVPRYGIGVLPEASLVAAGAGALAAWFGVRELAESTLLTVRNETDATVRFLHSADRTIELLPHEEMTILRVDEFDVIEVEQDRFDLMSREATEHDAKPTAPPWSVIPPQRAVRCAERVWSELGGWRLVEEEDLVAPSLAAAIRRHAAHEVRWATRCENGSVCSPPERDCSAPATALAEITPALAPGAKRGVVHVVAPSRESIERRLGPVVVHQSLTETPGLVLRVGDPAAAPTVLAFVLPTDEITGKEKIQVPVGEDGVVVVTSLHAAAPATSDAPRLSCETGKSTPELVAFTSDEPERVEGLVLEGPLRSWRSAWTAASGRGAVGSPALGCTPSAPNVPGDGDRGAAPSRGQLALRSDPTRSGSTFELRAPRSAMPERLDIVISGQYRGTLVCQAPAPPAGTLPRSLIVEAIFVDDGSERVTAIDAASGVKSAWRRHAGSSEHAAWYCHEAGSTNTRFGLDDGAAELASSIDAPKVLTRRKARRAAPDLYVWGDDLSTVGDCLDAASRRACRTATSDVAAFLDPSGFYRKVFECPRSLRC